MKVRSGRNVKNAQRRVRRVRGIRYSTWARVLLLTVWTGLAIGVALEYGDATLTGMLSIVGVVTACLVTHDIITDVEDEENDGREVMRRATDEEVTEEWARIMRRWDT